MLKGTFNPGIRENTKTPSLDQSAILAFASAMFPRLCPLHACNENHAQLCSSLSVQAQPSCLSPNLQTSIPGKSSLGTQTDFRLLLRAAESRKSVCVRRLGKIRDFRLNCACLADKHMAQSYKTEPVTKLSNLESRSLFVQAAVRQTCGVRNEDARNKNWLSS